MHTLPKLEDYFTYCQTRKELNPKTLKAYAIDLRQYETYLPANEDPFSREILTAYISLLHERYKPKSIKRKIASLKAYFHYLEYEEYLSRDPFSRIDLKFREPRRLPRTIPTHVIQHFLGTLYRQKSLAPTPTKRRVILRDIAVIELLFATGIRISELCSLRKEQVDFQSRSLLIWGKGARERMVQIENEDVLTALLSYHSEYAPAIQTTGWFFVNRLNHRLSEQSVRFMINRYANLASIDLHITPHMFRHSFATLLLEADVDIRYIQKMLGHSSITTTEIYTSVSMKKQRDILAAKHPRNWLEVAGENAKSIR